MNRVWVHTKNGHYKVWGYDITNGGIVGTNHVILYWGKIGKGLQGSRKKVKIFSNSWTAENFIRDKEREKARKGYETMSNKEFFEKFKDENYNVGKFKLKYKFCGHSFCSKCSRWCSRWVIGSENYWASEIPENCAKEDSEILAIQDDDGNYKNVLVCTNYKEKFDEQ